MSGKKIITIFGATGIQGGSIAQTFLKDAKLKDWKIRGVTRNVEKESAKKLAAQGVEMVSGDLDDEASVVAAMRGSHSVYGVTNFWETLDPQREIEQGKNLARAAKKAGIKHYIWSSLPNVSKLSNGKLTKVWHFDAKAAVEEYVRELGIPATFLLIGAYMSNHTDPTNPFSVEPGPDNDNIIALPVMPSTELPLIDTAADTGKFVKAIVLHRDQLLGKRIIGASEYRSLDGVAEIMEKVSGKKTQYVHVDMDQFLQRFAARGYPQHILEDVKDMMLWLQDFGYFEGQSLEDSKKYVGDELTMFEAFLADTRTSV